MKALIYTFPHHLDVWVIDTICKDHPVIQESYHQERLDTSWREKIPFAVRAFLRYGFCKLDYHAMSIYDRNIVNAYEALPESSSRHVVNRALAVGTAQENLRKKKSRITFFFYYSLWLMRKYDVLFVYNGSTSLAKCLIKAARKLRKKIIFMEVGPLLNTITIDHVGINCENSLPREASFYTQWAKNNPELVFDSENSEKKPRIEVRPKRRNFIVSETRDLNQKYVFFPLQVFRDIQLAFGDWIDDVQELISIVRDVARHLPEDWRVITKEHPRCLQRYDIKSMENERFLFANGNATPDLIKNASLIVTLNSSVGLEAMLFNKPVVVLGNAFYAFDSLAHKCNNKEELIDIFKNPEQISFNEEARRAFLSYITTNYYLEGNMHKKEFSLTKKNQRIIYDRLDQKLPVSEKLVPGKRNLVIVRAGDNSLHEGWLNGVRNWDIIVSCFGSDPDQWKRDDITHIFYEGGKFDGLYDAFQQVPGLLDKYDYIMMADDDFFMTAHTINRVFEIMDEYNLQVAHPSVAPQSYGMYWSDFHNPCFKIRFTNFVEQGTVCMSSSVWRQILPTFEDNPRAQRTDHHLPRLTDNPAEQVAVIDEVQVVHTRGYGGALHINYEIMQEKRTELAASALVPIRYRMAGEHPIDRDHRWGMFKTVCHKGILANGREIHGRWAVLPYLILGWLKIFSQVERRKLYHRGSVRRHLIAAIASQIKGISNLKPSKLLLKDIRKTFFAAQEGGYDLPTIASWWTGQRLSWIDQLCLRSFVVKGHKMILYTHGHVENVPEGIEQRPDTEIWDPEKDINAANLLQKNPAFYAHIFCLHMLSKTDYLWVDTDVYCHQLFANEPWFFADEKPNRTGMGILRLPKDSKTLGQLIQTFADGDYPHDEEQLKCELRKALMKTGEVLYAAHRAIFYPLPDEYNFFAFDEDKRFTKHFASDTISVHLYISLLHEKHRDLVMNPPQDSWLAARARELGVNPSQASERFTEKAPEKAKKRV